MTDALQTPGAMLEQIGGNCPVQAEGVVDGNAFYFRARGNSWQFHVARTNEEMFDNDLFYYEQAYGERDYAAGWMEESEALTFIREAIAAFRASQKLANRGG